MHGEYKTPGGKLVRVDFDVADGQLANVMISGDFFLYPDEAFDGIAAALEGQPATLDAGELAQALHAAIPPGAELLGTSPEGIAIAVRRGLT